MEQIYNKQIEFQKLLLSDTTTQDFKNQMIMGLFEETAEIKRETPSKYHKKHQEFNRIAFLEECVDAQLYLFNLVLTEATLEEFKELIKKKQEVNIKRQQNDY